jgi:carbohydrate kinase (thermoresistant glucokinase family)
VIRAIVVMGVTASGKSTLGKALAQALGWQFQEGDTLHPAANIRKMAAGIALDDEDRRPFLDGIAQVLTEARSPGIVVSCSALKRSYRDRIRAADPDALFVLPVVSRDQLQKRLQGRAQHFMPASLLDSQLATLEPPGADECVLQIPGDETLDAQVQRTLTAVKLIATDAFK